MMTLEELRGAGIELHAVAAMAANRVIGRDGTLPWHFSDDLKLFKQRTLGSSILMGRKTFDSLGRPLPGRRNLVLSRTLPPSDGVEIITSLEELPGLEVFGRVYLIGGAAIYEAFLPLCEALYLTKIHAAYEGATVFPRFEHLFSLEQTLERFPEFDVLLYRNNQAAPKVNSPA